MISKGWENVDLNPYVGILNARNCLRFKCQAATTSYVIPMFRTLTARLLDLLLFKIIPVTYCTL